MKWYFVRHGEIDSNIKKIYAGQSPEKLTERGRQQASLMAKELINLGIEEIYYSPMARTEETAEIIGKFLGKRPKVAEAFRELSLGIWEGRSEAEIQRDFPEEWNTWDTRPKEFILEGRETLNELRDRILQEIERIKATNERRSVLVVTHVAIIRVLLLYLRNLDLNLYRTIPIPHGKIFHLEGL